MSRDAAVGPSQIDVETIDGTARGGTDYDAVARRTIAFTNETTQTFAIQTKDDSEPESAETFRIHLSNPGGCTVNPNFSVGPDATVTIAANDEATGPTTTRGSAATTGRPGTTNPSPSTAPPGATADLGSTTAPPTLPPTPGDTADTASGVSTTRDQDQIALSEDDDGGGVGTAAVVVALVVAAALGVAGWWTWQRRRVTPLEP